MSEWVYCGPQELVVPELSAQDDVGGTLVLRPGQSYVFAGDPPGDPGTWRKPVPPAPAKQPAPPAAPAPAPAQEG